MSVEIDKHGNAISRSFVQEAGPRHELKPCPSGHKSARVIGGPGTAGGPKYWAGCDHCMWRAVGDTQDEAVALWNKRAAIAALDRPAPDLVADDATVERVARAMFTDCMDRRFERGHNYTWPPHKEIQGEWLMQARAAIAALKEPT